MSSPAEDVKESAPDAKEAPLVIFDLESTIPKRNGHPLLLEFGMIDVNPQGLYETGSWSTLICPSTLTAVTQRSVAANGITQNAVRDQPKFAEVADAIYKRLHGKRVAGHNIAAFDIPVLKRAFEAIGHPMPEFAGVVDTCRLVRMSPYSNRAGCNTLDALSQFTGHGASRHRAVDDCRRTLDVLKSVCARLYLETELPGLFPTVRARPKPRVSELERAMQGLSVQAAAAPEGGETPSP